MDVGAWLEESDEGPGGLAGREVDAGKGAVDADLVNIRTATAGEREQVLRGGIVHTRAVSAVCKDGGRVGRHGVEIDVVAMDLRRVAEGVPELDVYIAEAVRTGGERPVPGIGVVFPVAPNHAIGAQSLLGDAAAGIFGRQG